MLAAHVVGPSLLAWWHGGRYLMYDLLPKAGFKAEEDGGKQQGGAGLKAFVLKHRQALEAMLPPCRLPYPRERAAWK